MGFVSVSVLFVGYMLVYASVANHGKFAVQPWAGIVGDAYDTGTGGTAASSPAASTGPVPASNPSPVRRRTPLPLEPLPGPTQA